MHSFKLFVAPGTCARVPTIALEEIGIPFETELVRMGAKQQKTPEYLALNPKGKVPLLIVDGQPITENVAILSWLSAAYPEAALLPKAKDSFERSLQIADLSFVSATLHPLVARIAVPFKVANSKTAVSEVKQVAIAAMMPFAQLLEDRFTRGPWWYGDQWSIVDAYVFWAWTRMIGEGFPEVAFPQTMDHAARMQIRPSVLRTMLREARHREILQAEQGDDRPLPVLNATAALAT